MRFNGLLDEVAVKTGLAKLRIYIKFIAKTTTKIKFTMSPLSCHFAINVEEKL